MKTIPNQRAGNKELIEMLGQALKEAETPRIHSGKKFAANALELERRQIPASVLFQYRNHPQMLRMSRGR